MILWGEILRTSAVYLITQLCLAPYYSVLYFDILLAMNFVSKVSNGMGLFFFFSILINNTLQTHFMKEKLVTSILFVLYRVVLCIRGINYWPSLDCLAPDLAIQIQDHIYRTGTSIIATNSPCYHLCHKSFAVLFKILCSVCYID